MDSRDVYCEIAQRTEDPIIRRRFELLCSEEQQHLQYLTERYEELGGDVPLKLPPSKLPKDMATPEERSRWDLGEVLDMAIEEERHAREFYLRAARETDDLSGRAMFRFLADMEYQHWMTLAQEKDMFVRYPNYGRSGQSPWRTERSIERGPRKEGG
jgi:rubrerythrin